MFNRQYNLNERCQHAVDTYDFVTLSEGAVSHLIKRDLDLLKQEIARKIMPASDLGLT